MRGGARPGRLDLAASARAYAQGHAALGQNQGLLRYIAAREDPDEARAVLVSTRYGTPTFEGLRVDFTIGTGLPPGA